MIGFNALGQLGRLGNQMFQFAALKGIARNRGYEYAIPPSNQPEEWNTVDEYYHAIGNNQAGHHLFDPFTLCATSELNIQYIDPDRPVMPEGQFHFNENLFNNCPDWVDIRGFFQSEKYFKHIKDEIKKDFTFKPEILEPCKEMMSEFDAPPISLHVRRTDYITNPNHSALESHYYMESLARMPEDREVLVFTDDPEWCKEQEMFAGDRFMIGEQNSGYVDMCLMTLCKYHIIANSSFSWWGAWLSDSEKVIRPINWFKGTDNEHLMTKDLIQVEGWETY